MRSVGIPIPALDPPWPDVQKIAMVTSRDAPLGWHEFAHEVAATAQPGGHSFPSAEQPPGGDGEERDRTAFLYRHGDLACGYLCLASRLATGRRLAFAFGGIPPRDRHGARHQALHHGRVGGCAAAQARCRTTVGRCSGPTRWRHAIRLGVGGAIHRQRLPPGPLRRPQWLVDRGLQVTPRPETFARGHVSSLKS